jgi:hypothetical protein
MSNVKLPTAFLSSINAVVVALPFFVGSLTAQTALRDLSNRKDILISLERSASMGDEPTYRLDISGDGRVIYHGSRNVFVRGSRTGHISRVALVALVEEFYRAHFWELNDRYASAATDQPTSVIIMKTGSDAKRVSDYGGQVNRVAPEALIQLENKIDEITNSKKWVKGSRLRRLFHWR